MVERLLTITDLAERLNRSESTIRYWITTKQGPTSFKLGRKRMVREGDLESWLAERMGSAG